MGRRHHDYGFGATPRELEMIEMQDAGFDATAIAEKMGISRHVIVARLSGLSMADTKSDTEFFEMIRKGSTRLAKRIEEVHFSRKCSASRSLFSQ